MKKIVYILILAVTLFIAFKAEDIVRVQGEQVPFIFGIVVSISLSFTTMLFIQKAVNNHFHFRDSSYAILLMLLLALFFSCMLFFPAIKSKNIFLVSVAVVSSFLIISYLFSFYFSKKRWLLTKKRDIFIILYIVLCGSFVYFAIPGYIAIYVFSAVGLILGTPTIYIWRNRNANITEENIKARHMKKINK